MINRKIKFAKQRFPRPGVIQEIVKILERARDRGTTVTTEQILTGLSHKFPDRDIEGMEITVRAQLSRLPAERGVGIHKERDGRIVRYAAA